MNLENLKKNRLKRMKKPNVVVAEIAAAVTASTEAAVVRTIGVKVAEVLVDEVGVLSVILHQEIGILWICGPEAEVTVVQCMKDCQKDHLNALINLNQE